MSGKVHYNEKVLSVSIVLVQCDWSRLNIEPHYMLEGAKSCKNKYIMLNTYAPFNVSHNTVDVT